MRETLHIRLRDPSDSADVAYAITASEPAVSIFVQQAPLTDVIALAGYRRVVVYVPSTDVRLLTANVPAKQAAQALAAAPYALEEQFAEDVEHLHFAVANKPNADGEWPVAVVNDDCMRDWLAPFTAAGVTPAVMIAETLALPWDHDERWTVLVEPDHITVRTDRNAGFGCLPEDFELFLGLAEAQTLRPLRILLTHGVQADYTRSDRPVELLPGLLHPLEALVRNARLADSINLLQGTYLPKHSGNNPHWLLWKPAAITVSLAALALATFNGITALQLKSQVGVQRTQNETRYRQIYPAESRIVDLLSQTEQHINASGGSKAQNGMLMLTQSIATGLGNAPTLSIQSLQYRDGALFVSLSGSDTGALDTLRNAFSSQANTAFEVQSANSTESGLQIRIKLSPA